eukprot:354762-Chlamydomonas_euryale.AAC.9
MTCCRRGARCAYAFRTCVGKISSGPEPRNTRTSSRFHSTVLPHWKTLPGAAIATGASGSLPCMMRRQASGCGAAARRQRASRARQTGRRLQAEQAAGGRAPARRGSDLTRGAKQHGSGYGCFRFEKELARDCVSASRADRLGLLRAGTGPPPCQSAADAPFRRGPPGRNIFRWFG